MFFFFVALFFQAKLVRLPASSLHSSKSCVAFLSSIFWLIFCFPLLFFFDCCTLFRHEARGAKGALFAQLKDVAPHYPSSNFRWDISLSKKVEQIKGLTQDANSSRCISMCIWQKPSHFRVLNRAFRIAKRAFPCSKVGVVLKGRGPLKSSPSLWWLALPLAPPPFESWLRA